jgi:hypothetical protein
MEGSKGQDSNSQAKHPTNDEAIPTVQNSCCCVSMKVSFLEWVNHVHTVGQALALNIGDT